LSIRTAEFFRTAVVPAFKKLRMRRQQLITRQCGVFETGKMSVVDKKDRLS